MNQMDSDETENLAVQSEFGYNHFGLDNRLEELRVSDHPHLDPDQPARCTRFPDRLLCQAGPADLANLLPGSGVHHSGKPLVSKAL